MPRFLKTNLWSLLPVLGAVMLVLLVETIASVTVDISCQENQSVDANWLVCGDANKAIFVLLGNRLKSPDRIAANVTADPNSNEVKQIGQETLIAAQEGKARLVWIAAAGILFMVAIAGSFGSLYLAYDAFAGHARAVAGNGGPLGNICKLAVTIIIVCAVIGLVWQTYLIWLFQLDKSDYFWLWNFIRDGDNALSSDGLTTWWSYIPVVARIHHVAAMWAGLALIGLMALVTAALYQGAADEHFRLNPAANSNIDDETNVRYRRYLGRSFARLRYGIYLGAALLAVLVAETAARYAWPASLLSSSDDKPLFDALNAFGQEYALVTGLFLSLLLAVLYYPAVTVLRNRGREYYRARKPTDTLKQQEEWLDGEGLSFKFSSNWSEFIALLAPAAAGLLPHFTGLS
jgi:hypothetical protein